jgi:hypothetical protein
MTDSNHRPEPDFLEPATGALRAAPVPVGPPAEVAAATVAAIHNRLAGHVPAEPARSRLTRRTVMRYLGYGSAATAAAALLALWLTSSRVVALDDVLERVEKVEAVKFVSTEFKNGKETNTQTVVVKGNKIRIVGDNHPIAFVIDHDAKGAIILDSRSKKYQTMDLSQSGILPAEGFGVNLREQVQSLKKQDAKYAGKVTVDGAVLDKYTVADGAALGHRGAEWEILIDRGTKLPVKMTSEFTQQVRGMKMDGTPFAQDNVVSRVYEKFEWEPKLDKGLFGLDPPEGYVEGEIFRTIPPIPPYKKK